MQAMMFFGLSEFAVLFLALGTTSPPDLVSLISAPDYFQARSIEVKTERLVELAGKEAKDGQSSIAQLLAIRWLGTHPREVKKSNEARALLEQIAAGKKGKDPLGFTKVYALRALARLDGKPLPVEPLPADSLRGDALSWFPARATIFGGLDARPEPGTKSQDSGFLRTFIKLAPVQFRQAMYDFADRFGNVRLDRASFAVVPDPRDEGQTRIFVRVTGLADRQRFLDYIRKEAPMAEIKENKGADGERITVLSFGDKGPGLALIGNKELLIGAFAGASRNSNHVDLVHEALQVRAGKKVSIVKGPYSGTLKNVPARASGLLVGDLPEEWSKILTGHRGSPFLGFPKSFNLTMTRSERGAELRFQGSATSGKEAQAFVESINKLKTMGRDWLKNLPRQIKVKPQTIETLQGALMGIKVESRDALLTGNAVVSRETMQAIKDLVRTMLETGMKGMKKDQPLPAKPK